MRGKFALADQLEVRLAKARGQVDQLTPSLLARAFAGKLVPQNSGETFGTYPCTIRTQVPSGRPKIAQRFIAGSSHENGTSPVRDERTRSGRYVFSFAPPGLGRFSTRNPRLKPWAMVGVPAGTSESLPPSKQRELASAPRRWLLLFRKPNQNFQFRFDDCPFEPVRPLGKPRAEPQQEVIG